MKRNLWVLVIAMSALVFAFGCGDDGGDDLKAEDAAKVYTAVSTAVSEAMTEVMSGLGSAAYRIKDDDERWMFGEDGNFSGTIAGPKGGSATVTGSGSISENHYTYNFTITFDDYGTTDLASGGDLFLNGEVTYDFEGSLSSYQAVYKGSVTASGAVEGTAKFDLTITMSEGRIEISGTVGGQKIGGSYSY